MKKFLSLAVMILLAGSVCTQAQTKAERKAREAETVKTRLENRDYTIEVLTVHPMGGRSIQVTPDFTLTVKGDSVRSVLPYFGRAYTVPYGGGNGLRFEAVTRDYRQEYNKKRKETQITFSVRTDEDNFQFRLSVFGNGSSMISVQCNNREGISYNGRMATREREAEKK